MTRADDNAARLEQHERLVEALLHQQAALGTPPAGRSHLHTAISSLIVAGDDVIKLRKPLQLDFLDFSTLALRRVLFQLYALLKVHLAEEEAYLRIVERGVPDDIADAVTAALAHPVAGG